MFETSFESSQNFRCAVIGDGDAAVDVAGRSTGAFCDLLDVDAMFLAELLDEATDLDDGQRFVVVVDKVEHVELETFELDDFDGEIIERQRRMIAFMCDATKVRERAVATEPSLELVAFVFSFRDDEWIEKTVLRDVLGEGENFRFVVEEARVFFFVDHDVGEFHNHLLVSFERRCHHRRTNVFLGE